MGVLRTTRRWGLGAVVLAGVVASDPAAAQDRQGVRPHPYAWWYDIPRDADGCQRGVHPDGRGDLVGREPAGGTSLQYYRYRYPYAPYRSRRITDPHTFDAQFGRAPARDGLTLRFRRAPGYSPFSRCQPLQPPAPVEPPAAWPESNEYESGSQQDASRPVRAAPAPPPARPAPVVHRSRVGFGAVRTVSDERRRRRSEAEDEAWLLLASGKADGAQRAFSALALAWPERGAPRVGYAVSAALADHHDTAVFIMRRAYRLDPRSLAGLPRTPELELTLRRVLRRYELDAPDEIDPVDALFMSAALHHQLREPAAAKDAIAAAIRRGDTDFSTLQLSRLLRGEEIGPDPVRGRELAPPVRVRRFDLLARYERGSDRRGSD